MCHFICSYLYEAVASHSSSCQRHGKKKIRETQRHARVQVASWTARWPKRFVNVWVNMKGKWCLSNWQMMFSAWLVSFTDLHHLVNMSNSGSFWIYHTSVQRSTEGRSSSAEATFSFYRMFDPRILAKITIFVYKYLEKPRPKILTPENSQC